MTFAIPSTACQPGAVGSAEGAETAKGFDASGLVFTVHVVDAVYQGCFGSFEESVVMSACSC